MYVGIVICTHNMQFLNVISWPFILDPSILLQYKVNQLAVYKHILANKAKHWDTNYMMAQLSRPVYNTDVTYQVIPYTQRCNYYTFTM